MKRTIRWMGVLGMCLAAAGCGQKEKQVVEPSPMKDSEVAIWVDQAGITQGQIQHEALRLFSHVPQDIPADKIQEVQARLLGRAVDNLIMRQLVKAEMERSGVLISREEVEQGKQDLEKGLGEGHSLTMLLAAANLTVDELEANLKLDLFKNKVLKDKVDAALAEITEDTARQYYDENLKDFTIPAGREVSHILIRVAPDADEATKADARARAEGARKALLEGADFANLAREISQCASRAQGGNLGVVPRGREAPAFEEAVYSQKIGDIGEVVESPVGFHVIKVTGEQEEQVVPFDQIQDRLLAQLKSQAQRQIASEYVGELKDKATIKLAGPFAEAAAATAAAQEKEDEETPGIVPAPAVSTP